MSLDWPTLYNGQAPSLHCIPAHMPREKPAFAHTRGRSCGARLVVGGGGRSSFVIGLIENRAKEVSHGHAVKLPPHFPGCSINPRELG